VEPPQILETGITIEQQQLIQQQLQLQQQQQQLQQQPQQQLQQQQPQNAILNQNQAIISPNLNAQNIKQVITLPKSSNITNTNINTPTNSQSPQIITLLKNQNGLAQMSKVRNLKINKDLEDNYLTSIFFT
jgi:hypothetical protein